MNDLGPTQAGQAGKCVNSTTRASNMSNWLFTSNIFQLEKSNQYNPDKNSLSSDGWGLEFADWLKPELERSGYQVPEFEPDTCGWRLELPFDSFHLVLTCMVSPAGSVSNADELDLNGKDLWQLYTATKGPHARGGLLKKMLSKADPVEVAQRDIRLASLNQDIARILNSEADVQMIDGEPKFED